MEMDSFSPLLQRLAVAFLKFDDECIAGGLEILFNYLQFALHSNLRISKTIKGLAIIPPMTSSNAQVFNSS